MSQRQRGMGRNTRSTAKSPSRIPIPPKSPSRNPNSASSAKAKAQGRAKSPPRVQRPGRTASSARGAGTTPKSPSRNPLPITSTRSPSRNPPQKPFSPKSPGRNPLPITSTKSPSRAQPSRPLFSPNSPSRNPRPGTISTPIFISSAFESPSGVQTPNSLQRKRPAQYLAGKQMPNLPLLSSLSTPPAMSGSKKLELLAKAEARSRNLGLGQDSTGTATGGCGVPWVDKHLPQSLDDLFVHKKKVEEVLNWLEKTTSTSTNPRGYSKPSKICVLNGPAGSGKTATIQLVGKQFEFDVREWINPMSLTNNQYRPGEEWNKDDIQVRNQTEIFVDFIFRTSQYRSLPMKGKTEKKHRLILVEDIPNILYRDVNVFHDLLRKYNSTGMIPLVFVFTDTANGDHSMYKMFPKTLLAELNISNISFNPVASSLMVNFLLGVCTKESIPVEKSKVEEVAAVANGDLRCAINSLQFSLTGERCHVASSSLAFKKPPAKRGRKQEPKITPAGEAQQKDSTIQLFRALGKVLYAKRDDKVVSECENLLVGEMESERRPHPLIESPENICNKVEVTADTFLGFLHQNYPPFYGSMGEMQTASEYLSTSDFILNGWKFDDSGGGRSFKVKEVKDLLGMNIAVRGLMHSNNSRVSVGWKPLTKPLVSNLDTFMRDNVESTRQALFHLRELQTTLFTESIPFYAKLLQSKHGAKIDGKKEILEKGLFQAKIVRAVALDEKETVQESSEEMSEGENHSLESEVIGRKGKGEENENGQTKKVAQDVVEELEDSDFLDEDQFFIEEYDD